MDSKVVELLNDQVNKEFYSAYLYLEFANYYDSIGLDGFENWYRVQAQEERDHAMLFYDYLHNNDIKVELKATVMNNSGNPSDATVTVEIFDPATGKISSTYNYDCNLAANGSETVSTMLDVKGLKGEIGYRIKAANEEYSDGEPWRSEYRLSFSNEGGNMTMTAVSDAADAARYVKGDIPDSIISGDLSMKSHGEDTGFRAL